MPAAYQIRASGGVLRTADGALIPNEAENTQWQEYLAWVSGGGTADPATALSLGDYQAIAKRGVDLEASRLMGAQLPNGSSPLGVNTALLVDEARRIEADGTPSGTNYPLLNRLVVASVYADLATAGSSIRSWWAARTTALGDIEAVRRQAQIDIDAAGSSSAVDTVVAGVTWP